VTLNYITQISTKRNDVSLTLNISETAQLQWITMRSTEWCHFQRPWMTPQGHGIFKRQITRKKYMIELYL